MTTVLVVFGLLLTAGLGGLIVYVLGTNKANVPMREGVEVPPTYPPATVPIKERPGLLTFEAAPNPKIEPRQPRPTASHPTRPSGDDGFGTSLIVGAVTDNPVMGLLAGGNFAGAMIGYGMAESNRPHHQTPEPPTGSAASAIVEHVTAPEPPPVVEMAESFGAAASQSVTDTAPSNEQVSSYDGGSSGDPGASSYDSGSSSDSGSSGGGDW